jgi:hypothetical protein
MADSLRQRLDSTHFALKKERSSFLPHWRDLSDFLKPRASRFLVTDRNQGNKRNPKIIDSTATLALRTLASGMMSGITSPARPWFGLRTPDPELNAWHPAKVWLDEHRARMAEIFLKSNLYTTLPGCYSDLGAFGTHAFSLLEDDETVIRSAAMPIGSYVLGTDHRGRTNQCFREFSMTAHQLVEKFGKEACSVTVQNLADRNPNAWIDVIHAVGPNPEFDPAKSSSKFKRFESVYYEAGGDKDKVLAQAGYDEFPVLAPRWEVTGEDFYGSNCPGMEALGDVMALQVERRRHGQFIDKGLTPPMGAPSSLQNRRVGLLGGDITFYDQIQGQPGVAPLYQVNPAMLNPLLQDMSEIQQRIRRTFYEDLFLLISNDTRSNVTAREIAERHEEKLLMLGPVLERLNDELLDPLIARTWSIMQRRGMVKNPPKEILQAGLSVEYVSVMAQAQKMTAIMAIQETVQFAGMVGTLDPRALKKVNGLEALNAFSDAIGAPPKLLKPDEQVAAEAAAEQQAQQNAQALAAAQQAAETGKTLADTQVTDPSALSELATALRGGYA